MGGQEVTLPLPDFLILPGCQRCAWEPWAAPGFLAVQPLSAAGTKMAWQGWREKEAAPIPTACCLFLMVNGNSITASHRSQGGEMQAAQGLWAGKLRRCHHSCDSAGVWTMLQWAASAWKVWDVSPLVLPSRLFCLVPDFLIYFPLLPSLLKKRWHMISGTFGLIFGLLNN